MTNYMSQRFPFTAVCLLSAFTIPSTLHADVVTLDYSGTYFQVGNPAISGTLAGSFTFDNMTGTVTQATLATLSQTGPSAIDVTCAPDLPFPLSPCNTFALPGGGLELDFGGGGLDELDFFVSESSMVGKADLTPTFSGGAEGRLQALLPPECSFALDHICSISSVTFTPTVPEPSQIFSLATGLVFLALRRLAHLHSHKSTPG